MSNKALRTELDNIALKIAKDIQTGNDLAFDAVIDAFKALTAYHLGLMKKGEKQDDGEDKTPTFSQLRAMAEGKPKLVE